MNFPLISRAVDGHQMYFGGSVVDKTSTVGREGISPTPPIIFTGGQCVRYFASFSTSLNFEPPAFENAVSAHEHFNVYKTPSL